MKKVEKILFNRNHIEIKHVSGEKYFKYFFIDSINIPEKYIHFDTLLPVLRGYCTKKSEVQYQEVTCKSPLGFYYTKKEAIYNSNEEDKKTFTSTEVVYCFGDDYYIITYPIKYGDASIDADKRPWELIDGGMEEHYIFDLYKELSKIYDKAKIYKLQEISFERCNQLNRVVYKRFASDVAIKLNIDIFGHKNGPVFQTNDEKIVAAGFDLKTSFRKM